MINFDKVSAQAPDLVDLVKPASQAIDSANLDGVRARVTVLLDHSGSVRWLYRAGTMQRLVEALLVASLGFDDDEAIEMAYFHNGVVPVEPVLLGAHQGIIERDEYADGMRWGSTNYSAGLSWASTHCSTDNPGLIILVTDGEPNYNTIAQTDRLIRDMSRLPVFIQAVGIGDDTCKFNYLRKIDGLSKRAVDNVGFFDARACVTQDGVDAAALYAGLLNEFPAWLRAARRKQIIH